MSKRPADGIGPASTTQKRLKRREHKVTLPTRNSIKCLPLELRKEIYRCLLDDLTQEPAHPHSEWPDFSRFQDYLSLLLTDRTTSAEVEEVFEKEGYSSNVVFYADNTCEIYDFARELADHPFFLSIHFRLRSRCDQDFNVGDDMVRNENEMFIENQPGFQEDWIDHPGFYRTTPYYSPKWRASNHGFKKIFSGHSTCSSAKCDSYTELLYPALADSIRLKAYVWKKRKDDCKAPCARKVKVMGIMELSGFIADICFRSYLIERARHRLVRFLIESGTPAILEKYSYKYPVTEAEFTKMKNGWVRYWFQDQDDEDIKNREYLEEDSNWPGLNNASDNGSDTDENGYEEL